MLGQGRIGLGGDLGAEPVLGVGSDQPFSPRPAPRQSRAGAGALAQPAPNRGWIIPKERGDVSHTMAGIHGGQGSFTDVVGGMRAEHASSVPDRHNRCSPL